jgi:protein-arginine kinase activator protein McsA
MSKMNGDIIFLKRRLKDLVEVENYEKAAVVKRWIDELTLFYSEDESKELSLDNSLSNRKTK